ncbi:MAG: phosphotransferase [Gammaproteobacteria bacterium]
MKNDTAVPADILAEYHLRPDRIEMLHGGNINASYTVTGTDSGEYILQRVHPMFAAAIHADIDAVTKHLAAGGMLTPRLIPNRHGSLYMKHDGVIWRLLTRIPGITLEQVTDTRTAAEAGALLARFHRALLDLEHEFSNQRVGVHDTGKHLRNLETALEAQREHARYEDIAPLAEEILACASGLPELPPVTPRKVHGDPKITNILFEPSTGKALCLIDFDTLGNMPLPLELGDALRSWCNPRGEDTAETEFSLDLFRAALEGYAGEARDFILEQEWRAFLPAVYRICIELAARFCADALNENYFTWDPRRFGSCSEHNEIRARGQLRAAQSLQSQYQQAEKIPGRIFR